MRAEAIGTLVGAALVVGAVAVLLVGATLHLRRARRALRRIDAILQTVLVRAEPAGPALADILAGVRAIEGGLGSLLTVATGGPPPAAPSMHEAVEHALLKGPDPGPTGPPAVPPGSMREAVAAAQARGPEAGDPGRDDRGTRRRRRSEREPARPAPVGALDAVESAGPLTKMHEAVARARRSVPSGG